MKFIESELTFTTFGQNGVYREPERGKVSQKVVSGVSRGPNAHLEYQKESRFEALNRKPSSSGLEITKLPFYEGLRINVIKHRSREVLGRRHFCYFFHCFFRIPSLWLHALRELSKRMLSTDLSIL